MTKMKRFLASLASLLVLSSMSLALATGQVNEAGVEFMGNASGTSIGTLGSSVVQDAAISKSGISWTQPSGYGAYRVWVDNTTSERMTVTITSTSAQDNHVFYVSAQGNESYTVNSAVAGKHTVTFKTSSGSLGGTVKVRISDRTLL